MAQNGNRVGIEGLSNENIAIKKIGGWGLGWVTQMEQIVVFFLLI